MQKHEYVVYLKTKHKNKKDLELFESSLIELLKIFQNHQHENIKDSEILVGIVKDKKYELKPQKNEPGGTE